MDARNSNEKRVYRGRRPGKSAESSRKGESALVSVECGDTRVSQVSVTVEFLVGICIDCTQKRNTSDFVKELPVESKRAY